jgi:secreted Zn-dependent insulinase-like peptidase
MILSNNIKYNITHNNDLDSTYVAVCVKTGSLYNPPEYQGLAHFLEHMLFLGSEKYPEENHLDKVLKMYGGHSNAFTSATETMYYFSINSKKFIDNNLLDILSSFFISPLFNPSAIKREINAVNSEHQKNINSDIWYIRQVLFSLSTTPYLFPTGNIKSLNKVDLRDKMIEFYNKYYCSENIAISITSNINPQTIEKELKKTFGKIPYKKCTILLPDYPLLKMPHKEYQIIPKVDDDNVIIYVWNIFEKIDINPSNLLNLFKFSKIDGLISSIISNNNINGLEVQLVELNLIKSLAFISIEEGYFMLYVYPINNDIITAQNINNYVKYYFDNLHQLNWRYLYDSYDNKLNFLLDTNQHNDFADNNIDTAANLHYYDKPYLANVKIQHKDYKLLQKIIKILIFDNCYILYKTNNDMGIVEKHNEQYYNIDYGHINTTPIESKKVKLTLTLDNTYLQQIPVHIKYLDTPLYEYKKNFFIGSTSKYNDSNVQGSIILHHHSLADTLENYILTTITELTMNYYLNKIYNEANEIGYNVGVNFNNMYSTITININGLNAMYKQFYENALNYIQNMIISNNIINHVINIFMEDVKNTIYLSTLSYFNYYINLQYPNNYSYENIYQYLTDNYQEKEFINKIKIRIKYIQTFKNLAAKCVFYGNMDNIQHLYKLNSPELNSPELNHSLSYTTKPKPNLQPLNGFTISHPNKKENNKLVVYSYHYIPPTEENNEPNRIKYSALLLLILMIMEPLAYNYLRTTKKLGYIVGAKSLQIYTNKYIFLQVLTDKDIDLVKNEMDIFIGDYIKHLQELSTDEFSKIKQSAIDVITQKYETLNEEFDDYYNEIKKQQYQFDRRQQMAKYTQSINKDDLYTYFSQLNKETLIVS